MEYFQLYDIPISFKVDGVQIKKKFYELSKKYHPDFYINEPQIKQDEILGLATLNNKAYHVLSHPLRRIEYVLELNNLIVEGDKYQLPQSFLMEMMDINEELMDLEFQADTSSIEQVKIQVDGIEASLFDELFMNTKQFDEHPEGDNKDILLKIRDIWYRQKYLLRIRESLNKFVL
ncbi:MAG TPA: Fe-S protein assembly co-chaperone HscB [Sphingobacteriaceae bacterium]|nr:Fe-S protein assembly co-chaperone HscB [Sphingobacteriaceae bacterium]